MIIWSTQYSPAAIVVYLDLEYIVFFFAEYCCPDPLFEIPEGVEVSPLGNFIYPRFSKWPQRALVEI